MQKGFTLIESALVILIMSIMSLTLQVGIKSLQRERFKAFVEQVEAGINYAQQMATYTGLSYEVGYNTSCFYIKRGPKRILTFPLEADYDVMPKVQEGIITFNGKLAPKLARTITIVSPSLNSRVRITVRIATGKTTIYYDKI